MRDGRRDPYRSLVSEFMLQQTQVSRVLERFEPFLDRFPTIDALAQADESEVLAAWSGLGYYRRARLLHACAKAICDQHGSKIPSRADQLMALPGVGRYTAGAISSIVFGQREALVDGNVMRVLQRLDARAGAPDEAWSWKRAEALLREADDPGVFNEGLMELGAVVCTPTSPACARCPLAEWCRARARHRQEAIPEPKKRIERKPLYAGATVVVDEIGRVLMEPRPGKGLWAGLWQCPTIEREDRHATPAELCAHVGSRAVEKVGRFTFLTTHRTVHFAVYRAGSGATSGQRAWVRLDQLDRLGVGNAQKQVLARAGFGPGSGVSSHR
ncbi:MAG: A/G-specific adenine glycosylase [Phycisphaerales bacterium]